MLFRATLVLLSQMYAFAALDEVYRAQTHESPVTKIITSEGVSVSGDRSGNLIVYKQTATGFIKDSLKATHNKAINSLYLMDGKILASGDAQGKIALWDTVTNSEIVSLELHTVPVVALHLKKTSKGDIEVYSFDRNGNGLVTTLVDFKISSKKTFSVNGNYRAARFVETSNSVELAIGERAGTISRFNIKSNNELRADNSARNPVVDISCDSLQKSCAFATRDKTIKVFDTQMKLVKSYATNSNKARLSSAKGILYYVDNKILNSVRTRSATKVDKVEHGLFNVETISVNQENRLVALGDRNGEVVFYKVTDSNDTVTVDDSLKKAICAKDVDGIRDLVKNGANVNAVDKDGNNALMNVYSCDLPMYTRNKILKVLLEGEAADVNQYNRDGKNFYDLAGPEHINVELLKNHVLALSEDLATEVEYENISEIERLLDLGADVNHLDFFDQTPLMAAAVNGNIELVSLLLNHKWIDINSKNSLDQTVFDLDIVDEAKVLIDEYIFKKETGRKLISEGIKNNDLSLVKKAVEEYGININVEDMLLDKLGEQSQELPSLYKAIRNKNIEIMDYLLSKGAFTSFKNTYFVHLVRYVLDLDSLDLLLKYGVDIKHNKDACDNIFVQYSKEKGNLDILKKIYLEYGYSLDSRSCAEPGASLNIIENIVNTGDRFAFRWFVENTDLDLSSTASSVSLTARAIAHGNVPILKALLAKGQPLESRYLAYVIRFNEDGSLVGGKALLNVFKKHIDLNQRLEFGYPLYDAIMDQNQKVIDLFFELGAKLNITEDGHFNYPIEAILEKENKELLDKFLAEGGDLNKPHIKEERYSVFHLAIIQKKYNWLKTNSSQAPIDVQNRNGASFTHFACAADNMDLALSSSQDMYPLLTDEDVYKWIGPGEKCKQKIKEIRVRVESFFKDIKDKSDKEIVEFVEENPHYPFNESFWVNGTIYTNFYRAMMHQNRYEVFEHFAKKGRVDRRIVFYQYEFLENKYYPIRYIAKYGLHLDYTDKFLSIFKDEGFSKSLRSDFVDVMKKHKQYNDKFLYELFVKNEMSEFILRHIYDSEINLDVVYNGVNVFDSFLSRSDRNYLFVSPNLLKYTSKYGEKIFKIISLAQISSGITNSDDVIKVLKDLNKHKDITSLYESLNYKYGWANDELFFLFRNIKHFERLTDFRFTNKFEQHFVKVINIDYYLERYSDSTLGDRLSIALKLGLDPNLKFSNGDTLLTGVVKTCNQDAVKYLLDRGADKKMKNSSGLTAYRVAKRSDCIMKRDLYRMIRKY